MAKQTRKHKKISDHFLSYMEQTFFAENEEGFSAFLESLFTPIGKTIRVNPSMISREAFLEHAAKRNWTLTPTDNTFLFGIDRENASEMALGRTLEHLSGWFYIQEKAASTSVEILSGGKVDPEPYLILDVAASPGGKTTQLAEMYPNALIIANEPNKDRLPPLRENLERMGCANVLMTNENGLYFGAHPETFDKILLDAPCSGEGTAFKNSDVLAFWHPKNIKTIARLQSKLIEKAFVALKTDGELLYSTCTLNEFENEGAINSLRETFGDRFEVEFTKRFWPGNGNGGFFIAKIRKTTEIDPAYFEKANAKQGSSRNFGRGELLDGKIRDSILDTLKTLSNFSFRDYSFARFFTYAKAIKTHPKLRIVMRDFPIIEGGVPVFDNEGKDRVPSFWLGRNFTLDKIPKLVLNPQEADTYLRGGDLEIAELAQGAAITESHRYGQISIE